MYNLKLRTSWPFWISKTTEAHFGCGCPKAVSHSLPSHAHREIGEKSPSSFCQNLLLFPPLASTRVYWILLYTGHRGPTFLYRGAFWFHKSLPRDCYTRHSVLPGWRIRIQETLHSHWPHRQPAFPISLFHGVLILLDSLKGITYLQIGLEGI